MKKNRVLSAVLAVMMLISMIACIALPAAALDYTTLPLASTAIRGDGINAYQINSVAELLKTCKVLKLRQYGATGTSGGPESGLTGDARYAIWNFETTDTIYITADLDMANWDYTSVATYDANTGKYTPNFYANEDASGNNKVNLVYAENDGSVTADTLQELFSVMYSGFSWGYQAGKGYSNLTVTFDGLGHTISNFYDTHPFIRGSLIGKMKNLTFANPEVDAELLYTVALAGVLVNGVNAPAVFDWTETYALTFENVHVFGAELTAPEGATNAGIFLSATNKAAPVQIKNCSLVGSSITDNMLNAANIGVGLLAGYANTTVDVENCFIYDSSIVRTNDLPYANGLLLGNTARNARVDYSFDNVAVVDCSFVTPNASATQISVLNSTNDHLDATPSTANNVYVSGNTYATSATATPATIGSLYSYCGTAANRVIPTFSNVYTDVADAYIDVADAEQTVALTATQKVTNMTLATVINEMNANVPANGIYWTADAVKGMAPSATAVASNPSVKFVFDDHTVVYVADATGKVTIDAETKALLAAETWADGEGQTAVLDFDNLTVAADTVYTVATHKLTYTAEANNTHSVTCSRCTEHTATGVACTPVAVPENDVAASYFAKAKKAYKCEFCTNTWFEEVVDSTYDAPYSVAFDAAEYMNNDAAVVVTVTPKADANMSGMHLDLAFSADYLDYVDYAPSAATVVVNEVTEGNLVIAMAKADGTTLTEADAITLTFKVQGLSNSVINAALTAAATLTQTTVGTGDDLAVMEALTKTVAATSAASYLDFEAGDVNSDGYVDLLDAVLIIQKLNGTIGTAQDAAFKLIAADVNNSGDVNTADVTLVLQYVCEMDVTFTPAVQEPTIVVVGA